MAGVKFKNKLTGAERTATRPATIAHYRRRPHVWVESKPKGANSED